MDYELAKKLKDAGFPMPDIREGSHKVFQHPEYVVCPTLSELIEACGQKFFMLQNQDGITKEWLAREARRWHIGPYKEGIGSTPEEAVANLWLELNKK